MHSLSENSTNRDESALSGLRGFEVSAIVVVAVVFTAILMCALTWKLRYKIVLRTVSLMKVLDFSESSSTQ